MNEDIQEYDEQGAPAALTRSEAMRFQSGPYEGQLKSTVAREHFREFTEAAAKMAVDMEQGIWIDPTTGQPWSGDYRKTRIANLLGFHTDREKSMPSFMCEPHFQRAVEWERIQREASTRMSVTSVKPLVNVAASAMLMETVRRALQEPEKIADRQLYSETRQMIELLIKWDDGSSKKQSVQTTINLFLQNVNGLPAASKKKAMAMFGNEVNRLMGSVKEIGKVIDAEPAG